MGGKVSVIVPIYNSEGQLEKCIDSIASQTYGNLEIILVNDGSTDSSGEICERYQRRDPRIVYLSRHNHGPGPARNAGLDAMSGQYVAFCDSDDEMPPSAIELLYRHRDGADLIVGGIEKNEHGRLKRHIPARRLAEGVEIGKALTEQGYFINPAYCKLYDSEIVQTHHIRFNDFKYGEDTYFTYSYLKHASSILFLESVVYHVNALDDSSLSRRRQTGSWRYMRALYEKGREIALPDDEARHMLLMRSVKTTALLEARVSRKSFANSCAQMRSYVLREEARKTSYRESVYNRIFNLLIRNKAYGLLYAMIWIRVAFRIGM